MPLFTPMIPNWLPASLKKILENFSTAIHKLGTLLQTHPLL